MSTGKKPRAVPLPAADKKKYEENRQRRKPKPPPKVWQKKTVADAVQEAAGGHGVNPVPRERDLPQNGGQDIVPLAEQLAVPIVPVITGGSIKSLALGALLPSVIKGFGSKDSNGPWLAYNYLIKVYEQALQGGVPAIQVAPRWFWETVYMLHPKSYRMKTGNISYSWDYRSETITPLIPMGEGRNLNWWVPSLDPMTALNGFMQLVAPTIAYNESLGQQAFQDSFNYFDNVGMYERIPAPGEAAYLHKDVSAFQAVYPEWGASQVAPNGGMALSILSEVLLQNPMLSKFAGYQSGTNWRGFQHLMKNAGTPCYISPRIATMRNPREISTKHSPIFKFYNFDHFFVQLSYTLAKAMELSNKQNATIPVAQCPLTPWEVQILLRQAMLNKFNNAYAQDLLINGASSYDMLPFSTCNGGASVALQAFAEPVYPRLFTEMIRAINLKVVKLKGQSNVVFVPVLARPPVVPQMGNFQYLDSTGNYLNIYNDVRVQLDIDLIDLSETTASPTRYITLNVDQISELGTSWNSWIRQLQPFLSPLCSLGNENGLAVLNTIFCTQHVVSKFTGPPVPPPSQPVVTQVIPHQQLMKKSSKSDFYGEKLEGKRLGEPRPTPATSSEFYQTVQLESLTSLTPLVKPIMKYFSAIVKPTYMADFASTAESGVTFQQVLQVEPFAIQQSSFYYPFGNTQPNLNSQFLAAATYDTRQIFSEPTEIETDLEEMQKRGDGGFFTSLAGSLGQALGWSGAGEFFDQVGKVVNV